MPADIHRPLGTRERQIMDTIWSLRRSATGRDVYDRCKAEGENISYNTVLTVMVTLCEKGWLTRKLSAERRSGRQPFLYTPVCTEAQHLAAVMHDVWLSGTDLEEALELFTTMAREHLSERAITPVAV